MKRGNEYMVAWRGVIIDKGVFYVFLMKEE
jgi:hypothetical protein